MRGPIIHNDQCLHRRIGWLRTPDTFASRVAPTTPLDAHMLLEVRVEHEPGALGLRGAVQLGLRFEKAMLALEPGLTAAEKVALRSLIATFRSEYDTCWWVFCLSQPPGIDLGRLR